MKYTALFAVACTMAFLASCTKEDSETGPDGLVKTIDSVAMDVQIGLMPLDDGQFVFVSNGRLVKLDERGNIIWKKPISEIKNTRAAAVDPGFGFVLFGEPFNPPTPSSYYACRYDADGNLLQTKQINLNFQNGRTEQPVSMIRLANGGFAITMTSSFTWSAYLKILDSDFNLVYSRVFPYTGSDWGCVYAQHLCEMPGGDIVMTASNISGVNDSAWINAAWFLTGIDGIVKSSFILKDSTFNQITYAVSPYTGGFFSVSSTKAGWLSNYGTYVNYYAGTQLAGTMQIDRFNAAGQFIGSRRLTGYSGYGVIKSIRKTPDGGYLLCGTVDNNGSSFSVSLTRIYLCKLDADLNEIWTKTFTTMYQAIGSDAIQTSDGSCLVTGNLKSFGNDYQMLMIRTDANGNY